MTKGVPLPKEAKRLIKALHDAGNSTIDSMLTIVKNTFGAECIIKKHLQKLISIIKNGTEEEINREFPPPAGQRYFVSEQGTSKKRRTRQSDGLTHEEKEMLLKMRLEYVSMTYRALCNRFISLLGEGEDFISEDTVRNICVENNVSRKVLEFRHCKHDPAAQLAYIQCIRHIEKCQFVSIDGMVQSTEDYHATHGYAMRGDRAIQTQVVIRSKTYAVMLACTMDGIIAYEIFEGNVTATEIGHFIEHRLKPMLSRNHFAILDNAKNQNNESVRRLLDDAFEGLYCFLSPYSPWYAPVEKVINLVKQWVRTNEADYTQSELQLLNNAILHYSVGHEGGTSVSAFFNIYQHIHDNFLRDIEFA